MDEQFRSEIEERQPAWREVIGLASLTVSARPLKSLPLSWAIAWSAPSSISTKPKPLDLPLSRSVMIRMLSTGPDWANKSFNFDRWKLTLYGEVLNVLGRENLRYATEVDTVNRLLSLDRDTMFPRLPIAGIKVEF